MASSLLTAAKPFIYYSQLQPPSPRIPPFSSPLTRWKLDARRRSSLRVSSMAQKWDPSKVVPQADRVLIRLEELPELNNKAQTWTRIVKKNSGWRRKYKDEETTYVKSVGGVLLPKSAVKFERYLIGEILSVGADVGEVEAGKKVLFSDINAYDVELGTEARHCFCKAGDLLAVVE